MAPFAPARWLRTRLLGQDCVLCGGASGGDPLCQECRADMPGLPGACPRCAGPSIAAQICGGCLANPPEFDTTLAVWRYAFPADRLVLAFKFGGRLALAQLFAEVLAERVRGSRVDLVVPMPLHRSRLAARGFNQAWEIARRVAAIVDRRADPDVLVRVRDTPPQVDLPHDARARNVRGAFECRTVLGGTSVAVVDDVMTTGTTLDEAARALRRAGAERVENWVIARTWLD